MAAMHPDYHLPCDELSKINWEKMTNIIKIGFLNTWNFVLGGWAVYFTVDNNFQREKGYPYLGSKDVDLGFDKISTAKKVIKK
ncbi:hypothetical protein, partial [Thioalkalivibrio sp.]|uniref:hypothetical protein n=1 Tax=Thioalkalivibrio sp. TaxID=2093813 RepID=UPI00397613D6